MSIFLSKADTRKLLLLHIIEESFQQQITISELKKRMEVSEFIVISAYEELKEDIKNLKEVFMTLKPLFADSKRRVDEGEMPFRFGEMPFHL